MKRREALGLIVSSLVLAACGSDIYRWNQKLIVTVQTPNGVRSGSAVTQVETSVGDGGLNGHVMNQSIYGEATVVDLGSGRYLFALLANSSEAMTKTSSLAEHVFRNKLPEAVIGKSDRENLGAKYSILEKLREARPVPEKDSPLLVTFRDLNDPTSVVEVKPDNLAAVFGAGFALQAITLEITDEAVTSGIVEKIINWLSAYPEPPLCTPKSGADFSFCAAAVHHGDFIRK